MNKRTVLQIVGFSSFFSGIGASLVLWDWRPVVIGIVLLLIMIGIDAATDRPTDA